MPKPRTSSLAEEIFIVPAAHVRLADVSFQTEMFELFHRTPGGRIGHSIGTPVILLGAMMLAWRAPGAAAPALVIGLCTAITVWGLFVDRLAGLATAIVTALLALAAFALAGALGPRTTVVALACVFGGCFVQTFSHMFEDVPPPVSGTPAFVSPAAWRRRVSARDLARFTLLTFGVFYWLEMWAALRLLPILLLHLLMRAGRRPELRRALDARVAAILTAPAPHWKRPDWQRPRSAEGAR